MGLKLPKVSMDVDKVIDGKGLLYLLELDVDDRRVQKIGITRRSIEDRVCEITSSYFKTRRYFPYVRPKRFREVDEVFKKEAMLLEFFKSYRYEVKQKFSGFSELVDVDNIDFIVKVYEEVVNTGEISEDSKKFRDKDLKEKRAKEA